MQAIISKYIPATNTRPSRLKASCERGSITISYDHELSYEGPHVKAVDALIARFVAEDAATWHGSTDDANPWNRPRACGQIPSGDYVHVFVDSRTQGT